MFVNIKMLCKLLQHWWMYQSFSRSTCIRSIWFSNQLHRTSKPHIIFPYFYCHFEVVSIRIHSLLHKFYSRRSWFILLRISPLCGLQWWLLFCDFHESFMFWSLFLGSPIFHANLFSSKHWQEDQPFQLMSNLDLSSECLLFHFYSAPFIKSNFLSSP